MSDPGNDTAVSKKATGRTTAALIAGAFAIAAASATAGAVLTDNDPSSTVATSTTVHIDATLEEITSAQTALKAVGCYEFPADGAYGPHTAKAVKAFQAASGLPEDGVLDDATSAALEAAAAAKTPVCAGD